MQNETSNLGPDWVRCESKSRTGQYFMFNKKTGESKWCSNAANTSQRNLSVSSIIKTPAQDRLKRLQSTLQKKKQSEPITSGERCSGKHSKIKDRNTISELKTNLCETVKESANDTLSVTCPSALKTDANANYSPLNKEAITSDSKNFAIPKSLPKELKSNNKSDGLVPTRSKQLSETVPKASTSTAAPVHAKFKQGSSKLQITSTKKKDFVITHSQRAKCPPNKISTSGNQSTIIESAATPTKTLSQKDTTCTTENENASKSEQKPNFLTKIREFCNKLINKDTVKSKAQKHIENKEVHSKLSSNSRPKFKARKNDRNANHSSVLQENERRNIRTQSPPLPEKGPNLATSLHIPETDESANARLQRIRKSLHLQQNNTAAIPNAAPPPTSSDITSECSYSSAYTSDPEPMDWQPIAEESSERNILSTSLPEKQLTTVSSRTSEHYTTVNENLMRSAAAKKSRNHWKPDHFYFVVDTNVFIQNLTFVEDLTTMKLCDTQGTVIYVPYCVLQELDKLKVRSPSESIKTRSVRAIKYLNKSFEEKHQSIHVQSAIDEAEHLIMVTSPDDSILNCCLQVKKHVENLLLLTEDINLQNKAMSNHILVATKSDLISKHESSL